MKYVDWVESVLKATVAAFDASETYTTSTGVPAIIKELGLDIDERSEPLVCWELHSGQPRN